MSLHANKPAIAIFVAGAVLVGSVLTFAFGGNRLFSRHVAFLLYFDDSVNGLEPGSLVKFNGVPIGYVDSVRLRYLQPSQADLRVPVFVQVDVERMRRHLGMLDDFSDPAVLEEQVRNGLRAKLEVELYSTGSMYVDFGFEKDAPPPPPLPADMDMPVIPTYHSDAGNILKTIQYYATQASTWNIKGAAAEISDKVDTFSANVENIPFARINRDTLRALNGFATYSSPDWQQRLGEAVDQMKDFRNDLTSYNGQLMYQSTSMIGLGKTTSQNIDAFNRNVAELRTSLEPGGSVRLQVDESLQKTLDLANSLNQKIQSLEQRPGLLSK